VNINRLFALIVFAISIYALIWKIFNPSGALNHIQTGISLGVPVIIEIIFILLNIFISIWLMIKPNNTGLIMIMLVTSFIFISILEIESGVRAPIGPLF
jgi:hypothetical protein